MREFSFAVNETSLKMLKSENPRTPIYKADTPEELDKEKLKRSVQSILNKLTPQKFETLLTKFKNLPIDTEEKLSIVTCLVFDNAVHGPLFSVAYANLCRHLATIKVPLAEKTGQFVNFRKLLLTNCQKEFERDRCDELESEEKLKALEEAECENKRVMQLEFEERMKKIACRQLGTIRFIGELFKVNMLIEPIIHECIKKLLNQEDEESLECLCILLKTVGKELDKSRSFGRENLLDTYLNQIQSIVDKRLTSYRVRFLLLDIIDLKKDNWVPRKKENNPHKKAKHEARNRKQLQLHPFLRRNIGQSIDSWTPSSSKSNKGNYRTVDPSKLKLVKPDGVEGIRLGPGGRGLSSWGRGRFGTKATDNDVKTALTKSYPALAEPIHTQSYEEKRESQGSAASSQESSQGHNNQLPPSIRKTSFTTKETENILEIVKDLTQGHDDKPQDIKKKTEVHPDGKSTNSEELFLRGPEYSEDEMEKKTKPLVYEFLRNNDFDEAVNCVMELASPNTIHMFINFAINYVLELSSHSRHMLGQLLHTLTKKKVITLDKYKKGFRHVLEMLAEFTLDFSLIFGYIGEILAPLFEDNEFPLTFLKEVLKPCIPSESSGLVVSVILHTAEKRKGTAKLSEVWRESGLQWSDFLGDGANVNDFIQKHKLEFIMSPAKVKPKTQMSLKELENSLLTLLIKSDKIIEIFDWINDNVSENMEPKFIRALVTAVHKNVIAMSDSSYKLDKAELEKKTTLLAHYIRHDETLQLQALYAIQALMNQLEHPSGLLHQIFDVLYDADVIAEDAFKKWELSDDPNEVVGKSIALQSSESFFTWLRNSESSDDHTKQ